MYSARSEAPGGVSRPWPSRGASVFGVRWALGGGCGVGVGGVGVMVVVVVVVVGDDGWRSWGYR